MRRSGPPHDGLTIQGTKKHAEEGRPQGKNAKDPDGQPANNGIETVGVDDVHGAQHDGAATTSPTVFHVVRLQGLPDEEPARLVQPRLRPLRLRLQGRADDRLGRLRPGRLRLLRRRDAGAERSRSGRSSTTSTATRTCSATPGTNSKYVKITKSNFYNNGAGVVPNTLDSERFEPTANGIIENNNIFWNNFNYFLPNSQRQDRLERARPDRGSARSTTRPGSGSSCSEPTAGSSANNNIFGNFKCREPRSVSDPFNEGDDAICRTTSSSTTRWAAAAPTPNQVDFFTDGAGSANCYSGQRRARPSTRAARRPTPACIRAARRPRRHRRQRHQRRRRRRSSAELARYVAADPPETQQCSWAMHDHPAFEHFKPLNLDAGADMSMRRRRH